MFPEPFTHLHGRGQVDLSKLDIRGGTIHYRLYQQDGRVVHMTCANTPDMQRFVDWVQAHDRYTPTT